MINVDYRLITAVALAGLLVGFAGFQLAQGDSYCSKVEQQVRQDKSFSGTLSCHTPSAPEARRLNLSDIVENRTRLACVCVNRFMGEERIFTINVAG